MEGRYDEWEARGKCETIIGQQKIEQHRKKKYTMALNGCRPINFHATTNQKQVDAVEERRQRRRDHQGAWGGANQSFWRRLSGSKSSDYAMTQEKFGTVTIHTPQLAE